MKQVTMPWVASPTPPLNEVTLRPIQLDDASLIHDMHQRLSIDSIYQRYLQVRKPTFEEIVPLCQLAPQKGAGLVATVHNPHELIVGLAYYVRETQSNYLTAEPGILVEDRWQGQGIGRRLWQQLHDHAQANQVQRLRVLFAPNNYRVLHLLHTSGFPYQAQTSHELIEYLVALDESTPRPQGWGQTVGWDRQTARKGLSTWPGTWLRSRQPCSKNRQIEGK